LADTGDGLNSEFRHRVAFSVPIKSTQRALFDYLTDIENLSRFFPAVEFKLARQGPLTVGSIYHTRQKGARKWSPYRVLVLAPPSRMSVMLIGKDPLFAALRYDHRFVVTGDQSVSHETVDYTFRFGFAGRVLNRLIGARLVRAQVLGAHLKLKETAERTAPHN
jgi:Polyketide cyclase / dehydrase and lipid transport